VAAADAGFVTMSPFGENVTVAEGFPGYSCPRIGLLSGLKASGAVTRPGCGLRGVARPSDRLGGAYQLHPIYLDAQRFRVHI